MERRNALDGSLPSRSVAVRRDLTLPRRLGLRRAGRRLGHAGGVDHHGLHPPAAHPGPHRGVRAPHRPHHPRRGPHLRDGRAVPRVRHLRLAGPALRVGRRQAAAVLHREPAGPAAGGGHHRGRVDGQLLRGRHRLRPPGRAHGALLRLLLDVRVPAGGRPHLGRGRRPGPGLPVGSHRRAHHPAGRGPAAPGRPQPGAGLHRAHLPGLRPGLRLRDGRHRAGRHRPHVRRPGDGDADRTARSSTT